MCIIDDFSDCTFFLCRDRYRQNSAAALSLALFDLWFLLGSLLLFCLECFVHDEGAGDLSLNAEGMADVIERMLLVEEFHVVGL